MPATATNLIITTPRTSCIYFLPKIYKPNNPGRPIVSACSCPTELISSYLDKIIAPIFRSLLSYVKDSQHALQIFRDFNFLGEDNIAILRTMAELHRLSTPKFVARNIAAVESRPTSATSRATNFFVYPPSAAFRAIKSHIQI